jgi:hypothetical protein
MLDKRMDTLIGFFKAATELSIQENKIQTEISAELKQSGNENKKATQLNTRLTVIVIVLTAFGVIAAGVPAYHDFTAGGRERHQAQVDVDRVIGKLDTIGGEIATSNSGLRQIDEGLRREMEELRATVSRQAQQIDDLRKAQKALPQKGK